MLIQVSDVPSYYQQAEPSESTSSERLSPKRHLLCAVRFLTASALSEFRPLERKEQLCLPGPRLMERLLQKLMCFPREAVSTLQESAQQVVRHLPELRPGFEYLRLEQSQQLVVHA